MTPSSFGILRAQGLIALRQDGQEERNDLITQPLSKWATKLETNGKESSGKRTRHFDIKYFYITDLIQHNIVKIDYCWVLFTRVL